MDENINDEKTEHMEVDEKTNNIILGKNPRKIMSYDHVFGSNSTQQQIFIGVGKKTCDDVFSGFNGTIFV